MSRPAATSSRGTDRRSRVSKTIGYGMRAGRSSKQGLDRRVFLGVPEWIPDTLRSLRSLRGRG